MFDDEDVARLRTGVQGGGCRSTDKQRSAHHAGSDGVWNLAFYATQLADRCALRYLAIDDWLERFYDRFASDGVSSRVRAEIARLRCELQRGDAQMRFRFIEQHARAYPMRLMCRVVSTLFSGNCISCMPGCVAIRSIKPGAAS